MKISDGAPFGETRTSSVKKGENVIVMQMEAKYSLSAPVYWSAIHDMVVPHVRLI